MSRCAAPARACCRPKPWTRSPDVAPARRDRHCACFLLGLALLAVPGLVLSCMWAAIGPAYVAECGPVLSAVVRGRRLTTGRCWAIFGLTLVYGLVVGIGLGFLSGFAEGLATHGGTGVLVIPVEVAAALLGAAVAVVSASGAAALRLELRPSRDSPPGADLAEASS